MQISFMVAVVAVVAIGVTFILAVETRIESVKSLDIIEQRLQEYFEKDKGKCGTYDWADDYTALHKTIMTSDSPKFLVAVPHLSGMADRIIGYSTALIIAILTKRAFQMGQRQPLPDMEIAFRSPYINWTRAPDETWLIEPLHEKAGNRNYNKSVLDSKKYYAVNTINDYRLQDALLRQDLSGLMGGTDVRTTLMVGNRGKTIRMFENEHYSKFLKSTGMTPYTLFGCLTNYIIQPKKEIFLPVAEQFLRMTDPDPKVLKISIQIRTGDGTWDENDANINKSSASALADGRSKIKHFVNFFNCAKQIEAFALADGQYTSAIWYLATESTSLRKAAVEHFGSKIVTSLNSTIEHSAKEASVCRESTDCKVTTDGFTTAAAEWWMQGYADYHVITLYSGYGRSGAFRTLSHDVVYTVHNKPVTCSNTTFTDLENIMYDWSGI